MALIKSQLVLTDGMTGPLKSINKAMNIVLNSFEAMQDASGRAIDTASIQEAREELARASAALDQLEDHTNKSTDAFSRLAKAIGLVMIARKALDTSRPELITPPTLPKSRTSSTLLLEALRRLSTRGRKSVLPPTA